MKKIIYHGSDHIIEQPEFGYGKPYNDSELDSTVPKILIWQKNGALA